LENIIQNPPSPGPRVRMFWEVFLYWTRVVLLLLDYQFVIQCVHLVYFINLNLLPRYCFQAGWLCWIFFPPRINRLKICKNKLCHCFSAL